ncbi:MAG: acyl-CoA reductase-like NAD-dependent aldehyde dehydrogenase, partial [Myxococcota bacterium]
MTPTFQTISPRDGSVLVERRYADNKHIDQVLDAGVRAQQQWRRRSLDDRLERLEAFTAAVVERRDLLSQELSQQMGRPISQTGGEIDGFAFRSRTMLSLAGAALGDIRLPKEGFTRFIRREPIGLCLVLAPWNYPYLTAVNAIIPALAAGNTVLLKHSEQTPLCAERLAECAAAAGLPEGVFQYIHADHGQVAGMVGDPRTAFVAFTGSVEGGRAVRRAAAGRFIRVGLELGGKDPAYVRADADFDHAVANLVEGAFYNSGQSCCG